MTTSSAAPADLDARSVVGELFRAFNDHDVERIVALHAEGAVWEDPTLTGPLTGRGAIAEHLRGIFGAFPDFRFEEGPELFEGQGGRLGARWRFAGTMTGPFERPSFAPTGRRATVSGMCVYAIDGGRISRHEQYFDALGLLEQLGILPSPESASGKLAVGVQRATARMTRGLRRAS